MFGRKQKERLPWYRRRGYKGNLTEDEKRELDLFRLREKRDEERHPAATFEDIPEEVQSYISKIEIELYDAIQERLAARCFVITAIGGFYLATYLGWISRKYDELDAFLGVFLLIAPWIYYVWKWKRNADEFRDEWGNEGIRTEWELEHMVQTRKKSK
jgi:hypothetical protein